MDYTDLRQSTSEDQLHQARTPTKTEQLAQFPPQQLAMIDFHASVLQTYKRLEKKLLYTAHM